MRQQPFPVFGGAVGNYKRFHWVGDGPDPITWLLLSTGRFYTIIKPQGNQLRQTGKNGRQMNVSSGLFVSEQ